MIKLAAALIVSRVLISSFDYKNSSPVTLFPYYNAAIDYEIPNVITNPSYLPLINYSKISFSTSNPYSIENLSSSNLRLSTTVNNMGFQFSWINFGFDQYKENILEANMGYLITKSVSAGIGLNYYNIDINTDEISFTTDLYGTNLSLLWMPVKWLNISFLQENLQSCFDKNKVDLLYPGYSFGLSIRAIKGFSLTWNINKTPFKYINSFSFSANILPVISVKAGYSRETSSYSAAISVIYKHITVSYGMRYHSYLDLTHSIGIILTDSSQHFSSMDYLNTKNKNMLKQRIKRINIKTCTLIELQEVSVINDVHKERIIKFRKLIGTITKKSLFQIGLTNKEILQLSEYIYGLTEGKKIDKRKNRDGW